MIFKTIKAVISASLFFAPALPAMAQNTPVANGQGFGNWTVSCAAIAVNQTACVLQQRILRDSDRAFIADLLIFWSGDGEKSYLTARVPTGAYLPSGFSVREANGEDVISLVWQTCGADLCEAVSEVPIARIEAMAAEGVSMLGAFRPSLQSEDFVFSFSMAGAAEGLEALKPSR